MKTCSFAASVASEVCLRIDGALSWNWVAIPTAATRSSNPNSPSALHHKVQCIHQTYV